jgi:hypothetical protein
MRVDELINKPVDNKTVLTETVKRLQETPDSQFSKGMTGKELMEWVKSL